MTKSEKDEYLKAHSSEIEDIVELIALFKADGLNRLRIWAEFRGNGTNPDLILEAFRVSGLLNNY